MNSEIYVRPLREEDAKVSYSWRNDPEVWKYTGSKPDRAITFEIEQEWIHQVLQKTDEKRFAICLIDTGEYIGNVQLTRINNEEAEFHIFIGEKKYWGREIGKIATELMIRYAFEDLKLKSVYLLVKKENIAAIKIYEKVGFSRLPESDGEYFRFIITSS